jgi:hypothetical protein
MTEILNVKSVESGEKRIDSHEDCARVTCNNQIQTIIELHQNENSISSGISD